MPGKVKIRILAGRNLPVMDRASDTCDAFVELKLGNTAYKTEVFRHSLNPQWNSEWFRFEVDDEELQDEPLQIRVMDYDTYSANDAIGKVYIDLNPLLVKKTGSGISGWFPIYDTMHGLRGEINVVVKVHLFSDSNKYRESSCGVQFFYSCTIPHGYKAQTILGFVEELVVNDDPEYQWIDKIRTPRASNEARQTLFSKLSGEVQRKIGLKALELGGNAVIGYHQCFDLEGESGIVVRGIGTAVILLKCPDLGQQALSPPRDSARESPILEDNLSSSVVGPSSPTCSIPPPPAKVLHSPAKTGISSSARRSSDSDLSTTPKGNGLGDNSGSWSAGTRGSIQRPAVAQESLSMLEYPFITMKQFPSNLIQHIGGVVSARSVKLLTQINNPDEPETRDAWWTELRKEIRSHVKALGCNVVLGYMETTNINDEVCILSAAGTAAVLNTVERDPCELGNTPMLGMGLLPHPSLVTTSVTNERKECDKEKTLKIDINLANQFKKSHLSEKTEENVPSAMCQICHIPYSESSVPFPANLVHCNVCRKSKVPDVLFMTIEPPPNVPITGKGGLMQARVCKNKKDLRGEQNAKEISDSLPFLEYELHRQLLNKLKVKGMNAIFGLKVQVTVGDRLLIGLATGTGAYLSALPPPNSPKIICGKDSNNSKMMRIQKQLQDAVSKNKEHYGLKLPILKTTNGKSPPRAEEEMSSGEDDHPDIDLSSGNKDTCILEVDDAEDVDIISQLIDPLVPKGFEQCNTERLPGMENFVCNLQMFTRIFRTKLTTGANSRQVSKVFENVIKSLYVKLMMLVPCCLAGLSFHVELADQDEIQVSIVGVSIGLGDPSTPCSLKSAKHNSESELLFQMDDEKSCESVIPPGQKRQFSLFSRDRNYCHHVSLGEHVGVDITPLSYIPGKKIDKYLGDLDFFFIRESTSIRESGGLNGFIQSFVTEILAIVRAHVSALGGNAMVSFHMTQCILLFNPHKNQGQCLINVAGDAVSVHLQTAQHSEEGSGKSLDVE